MTPDPDNESPLVVVGTYLSGPEADLARSALEAAGIDSVIRRDDCGGTRPSLWMGGIALLVSREDAEEAAAILTCSPPTPDAPEPTGALDK